MDTDKLYLLKDTYGYIIDHDADEIWYSPKGPFPEQTISLLGIPVEMYCDFGSSIYKTKGQMYHIKYDESEYEDALVFSDHGGWCTQYVVAWRIVENA